MAAPLLIGAVGAALGLGVANLLKRPEQPKPAEQKPTVINNIINNDNKDVAAALDRMTSAFERLTQQLGNGQGLPQLGQQGNQPFGQGIFPQLPSPVQQLAGVPGFPTSQLGTPNVLNPGLGGFPGQGIAPGGCYRPGSSLPQLPGSLQPNNLKQLLQQVVDSQFQTSVSLLQGLSGLIQQVGGNTQSLQNTLWSQPIR